MAHFYAVCNSSFAHTHLLTHCYARPAAASCQKEANARAGQSIARAWTQPAKAEWELAGGDQKVPAKETPLKRMAAGVGENHAWNFKEVVILLARDVFGLDVILIFTIEI